MGQKFRNLSVFILRQLRHVKVRIGYNLPDFRLGFLTKDHLLGFDDFFIKGELDRCSVPARPYGIAIR